VSNYLSILFIFDLVFFFLCNVSDDYKFLLASEPVVDLSQKKKFKQKTESQAEKTFFKAENTTLKADLTLAIAKIIKLTENVDKFQAENTTLTCQLNKKKEKIAKFKTDKETTEALLSLHSRVVKLETMNEITHSLQAKYETEITELRQEILKIRNETTEASSSLESRLVKVERKNEKTNKTFSTMAYSVAFYGTIQCILFIMDPTQFVHDFKANAKLFLGRSVQKD
uniref:Uncharacterized protein n=1 Tax=Biomphalaria glabrata TaxID=6526 RepID=A0A2C9KU89_BIOGL